MIETVSKRIDDPNEEQEIIDRMSSFGWQLKSSQEINSKGLGCEKKGFKNRLTASKENYVKLIFDRDTEMKNYKELVELERRFYDLMNSTPSKPKTYQIFLAVFLLCTLFPIGILYAIILSSKQKNKKALKIDSETSLIILEARK